jgi:diguanylate cyclase (GGDEF)-like protein/PAS domain S-box-containing protein
MTSPLADPGSIETRRRQRLHSAAAAACISLLGALIIVAALVATRLAPTVRSMVELVPEILLIGLIATLVYRSRMRAYSASRAFAEHQERLRHVIEGTGVGIWETDFGGGVVHVSDSWLAMSGRSRGATGVLPLDDFRELIHPDDRAVVRSPVASGFLASDALFQFDHRLRHHDGHYIWVASRARIVERNADQSPRRMVGTHVDISSRKYAEAALSESEMKFRSLFERSPVGIALIDFKTGRFLQVNDALLEPGGYQRKELLRMRLEELTTRPDASEMDSAGGPSEREFMRRDGRRYPVLMSGIRMQDAGGRDVVWAIVQDISHRKAIERELAAAARHDRLTGLVNRSFFMERLQGAVESRRQDPQANFAVLFLDFDRFKIVNDAMGHQAGDDLLVQISQRLREALRAGDHIGTQTGVGSVRNLIARFGGDEFLVLLNDLHSAADAERISSRLLEVLSAPYSIQGREVHSTASIGIVTSGPCAADAETIVRNADVAMYEAKRAGRARSVVFSEAMHAQLSRNLMIETSLRKAIGTGQLSLVYQPIIELDTGRRASVEALLRWEHPELGPISPSEFVPVAEESGLISAIGEWVLLEACTALSRWRAVDPVAAPHVVSVNISRAELAQGEPLLHTVQRALAAAQLPAECLLLEVTEREVMRDPAASLALMQQLRAMGVHLAMDDFGTGTSSLGCLRDYPFDVIKIDRSFVSGLAAGPDTLAVIHATITLVENLGKTSVAEGVETAEQLAILQSLGCHYAQGYHLGRPMTESQILETLPAPAQTLRASA